MNKHDRVMEIFLTECKEVLEEVGAKLLVLEEQPEEKGMINDIFRGIHTLKGNANSFGFTRLGEFVHYFEDLLTIHRKANELLSADEVDLLIRAFDVVEEVFVFEEEQSAGHPEHYHAILNEIKSALNIEAAPQVLLELDEIVTLTSYEISSTLDAAALAQMLQATAIVQSDERFRTKRLYNVVMSLDSDIYLRGYNHQIFFRLLRDVGEIVFSDYEVDAKVPKLEAFDTEHSYIKKFSLYLFSDKDVMDIEDVFEFIAQEHEVAITVVKAEDIEKINAPKKAQALQNISDELQITSLGDNNNNNNKAKSSIRVESGKLDELFDSIGELVIAQSYISQNEEVRALNNKELNQYLDMLGKSTRLIQNKVMSLRMIPIRDTFMKMKRVVRDVSKKTNKEIELILSGEETEVDKTMVDKLSEPLIHLLRNSVDHGIEANAEDRLESGKEACGNIKLSASHKGSSFVIEIRDDGRGIDTEKILAIAIERGIAKEGTIYSEEDIIDFLFVAGFSTAASITDISGRGVGLDAVKQSIEEMRGKILVESEFGVGTTFRIVLPLTLAIIDGLTIRVDDETLILPTLSVVESFSPVIEDIHQIKGQGEFINYRGEILPIIRLNQMLGLSSTKIAFAESTFICIDHERGRFIIQVNELIGRQQVVIKSLGLLSQNIKEVAGVAILGTGNIAMILNVEGLRDHLDNEENVL